MTVGKNIQRIRKARGIKQEELALHLGFENSSGLSKIETNKVQPDSEQLIKISELLDVPIFLLFTSRSEGELKIPEHVLKNMKGQISLVLRTIDDLLSASNDP